MDLLKRGLFLAMLASCKPDVDQRATHVSGIRILAVRAEPAEAAPRDDMTFTALVSDGTAPTWAFCSARKPLAELGPVSPACYSHADSSFVALGTAGEVKATMPTSACRDFGPEVPQAKPSEPYGRPVDPDPTGGYYQPLSVWAGDAVAVAQPRIACGVAGASSDDVVEFRQRYHANENPQIVLMKLGDAPIADGGGTTIAPNARVTVRVEWPACPLTDACGDGVCGPDESRTSCAADCGKPVACAGAERYLWFDADARRLVARREALHVAWFSDAGAFDRDRTGRDEGDVATDSENDWVAPEAAGTATIWVVLRDDRGGVAWRTVHVDVR